MLVMSYQISEYVVSGCAAEALSRELAGWLASPPLSSRRRCGVHGRHLVRRRRLHLRLKMHVAATQKVSRWEAPLAADVKRISISFNTRII